METTDAQDWLDESRQEVATALHYPAVKLSAVCAGFGAWMEPGYWKVPQGQCVLLGVVLMAAWDQGRG